MRNITISAIADQIQGYLNGSYDYDTFRNFIYARYEGEEEIDVEDDADDVLSVLSPYVETEEAIPDDNRDIRLRRLQHLLRNSRDLPPASVTVFALKYDEISHLVSKRDSGAITDKVFGEQLRNLTPAEFDLELIIDWAEKQKGDAEPDLAIIA